MRPMILALTAWVTCLPAHAATCRDFLARFEISNAERGGVLPQLSLKKEVHAPDGFSIENLRNIDGSIACEGGSLDGDFRGLGASLVAGAKPDLDRWSLFLLATADSAGLPTSLVVSMQDEAMNAAERERIGTGMLIGGAEEEQGGYSISYTVMPNQLELSIMATSR